MYDISSVRNVMMSVVHEVKLFQVPKDLQERVRRWDSKKWIISVYGDSFLFVLKGRLITDEHVTERWTIGGPVSSGSSRDLRVETSDSSCYWVCVFEQFKLPPFIYPSDAPCTYDFKVPQFTYNFSKSIKKIFIFSLSIWLKRDFI